MSQRPADYLQVRGLELDCIVGVRPHERTRPQRVRLDVTLGLSLSLAGRSGRFSHTVDYARVADEITALLRFREYRLVEMATEEIAAMLFAAHPALESVELRLEKPEALQGRALAAAVHIARSRQNFRAMRSTLKGADADCVLETQEARLWLMTVPAGESLVPPAGRVLGWVTQGSLQNADQVWAAPSEPCVLGAGLSSGPEGATLFACQVVVPG